jgi:adenylate cyclase
MTRRLPALLAITITLLFAVLEANRLDWTSTGFLASLDMRWLDAKFRLRGPRTPSQDLIIVGLDDRTTSTLGSARVFERHHAAALVDAISSGGPAVIGFDILYSDADVSDEANDRIFAEAIKRAGNAVLGVYLDLK